MEQVTITKIFKSDKDKNGNKLMTRDGREYTKLAIKTSKHGERWLSGFANNDNADWKVGDTVDVDITVNGEYLNYKPAKRASQPSLDTTPIMDKLNKIESLIVKISNKLGGGQEYTDAELQPDETTDLPF